MARYIDAEKIEIPLMEMKTDEIWMTVAINSTPTEDVRPIVHGKWIPVDSYSAFGGDEEAWLAHGNPTAFHYCSNCKEQAYANEEGNSLLTDFCPNCGADMRAMKTTFKGDRCDLNTALNNKKNTKKYILELIKLLKNGNRTN